MTKNNRRSKIRWWIIVLIYLFFGAVICFVVGYFYFYKQTKNLNIKIQHNLKEAKQVYNAIPIWHKKIQTKQDIKFGIITDTHVEPKMVGKPISSSQMRPIYSFVNDMMTYNPEFVVNLGDVIDGSHETPPVGSFGLQSVKKAMEKIGVPVHFVIGNHDLRSVSKEQFKNVLGLPELDYTFDIGDYRFIIVDANYLKDNTSRDPDLEKRYIPGHVPPQTLQWLKEQLSTNKRVLVFMHQGTFNHKVVREHKNDYPKKIHQDIRTDWVKENYGAGNSIDNAQELRDIFDEYRVDGFFNGHMEARWFEKGKWTAYYSLIGTRKSKQFPSSYYEVKVKAGIPEVVAFHKPKYQTKFVKNNFEDKSNRIYKRNTILKNPKGMEWWADQWIEINGNSNSVVVNKITQYKSHDDILQGIAVCDGKYWIGAKDELILLDSTFEKIKEIENIDVDDDITGVACSRDKLYIITQNKIYSSDFNNNIETYLEMQGKELAYADFDSFENNDILFVCSYAEQAVFAIKDKKIIDRIPLPKETSCNGLKASKRAIDII